MLRTLDLAVLRSFLLIAQGRSFVETADLVGRSPSAVSLHIQKLEEELGVAVLRRNARGVELTPAGERLLGFARRLLSLNDETIAAFRVAARRPLRVGATQDMAEAVLPDLLRRFALAHPEVELTLRIDRSQTVIEGVRSGALDVAIALHRDDPTLVGVLAEERMLWIGARGLDCPPDCPLPLALFEPPCSFRTASLDALTQAGRAARLAVSSPSLAGLRAAVEAGVGVTARTRHSLTGPILADVGAALGLPPLPTVVFCLYAHPGEGWTEREDFLALCRHVACRRLDG